MTLSTYIVFLLAGAVTANMIAHWYDPIAWVKQKLGMNEWPIINCCKCTGFWLGLGLAYFMPYPTTIASFFITPPLMAFCSYLVLGLIYWVDE